jgi:RNA polymerase sigma factor (sigma-70 family)
MVGVMVSVKGAGVANEPGREAWMREFSAILPGMMTTPPDTTDHALMQRYCDGDLLAFKELYRRHNHGFYQFIAWRSPRKEWVEEIVQDSWAALHEARGRYEALAGFRTYLYQIGRNRLIDILRQKQAVLASEIGGGAGSGDDGAEGADGRFEQLADAAHEGTSPEVALEKKQQVAALHAAIRGLPGEQKEALVLQQFNGLSLEEIAQITAVSVETVKSRLRYAMQKLRSQLQGSQVQGAVV